MKVLSLCCPHDHRFDGWFASEEAFQQQLGQGLVACPLCGDPGVVKLPSAPRLNFGAAEPARLPAPSTSTVKADASAARTPDIASTDAPTDTAVAGGDTVLQEQAAFLRAVRQLINRTEDVGEQFAEEARRIHYGESKARAIRGQASREETLELLEEGIGVLPLPLPRALKEPLQ